MKSWWRKDDRIREIFLPVGSKKPNSLPNKFTIIYCRQEKRKGYIIMEIMSTNVTNNTIYRGYF